jgi:hypothetical protein
MKRTLVLVSAVATALTVSGFAVANGFDDAKTAKAVTAAFAATTPSKVETATCTTSDGKTVVRSSGTYTGTSSGDPDLAGPITVQARSTINTTDGVGVVSGSVRIDSASSHDTRLRFEAVYQGGQLAGLASGTVHDSKVKLLANVSSGFTAAGGFTSGKLGGTSGGGAVALGPGRCERSASIKQSSQAKGTVTAVSATSITIAGLTCSVPVSLQSVITGLTVGARAEIRCSLVDGANALVKVSGSKRR